MYTVPKNVANVYSHFSKQLLIKPIDSRVCLFSTVWSSYAARKGKDQPGKVANPAPSQLNRENECFPDPVCA